MRHEGTQANEVEVCRAYDDIILGFCVHASAGGESSARFFGDKYLL